MKTAKQTASEIREALGDGLRFDPCLTTGKSLIETLVECVQADALNHAARLSEKVGEHLRQDDPNTGEPRDGTPTMAEGAFMAASRICLETNVDSQIHCAGVIDCVRERLKQHRENLALWESGALKPTLFDVFQQRDVKLEFQVAISELEAVLKQANLKDPEM